MGKWLSRFTNWNYLLFYKWLSFNFLGAMLAFHVYMSGFLNLILENDASNLSYVILGVFIFSVISSGVKTFTTSKEINSVKNGEGTGKYHEFKSKLYASKERRYQAFSEALKLKMYSKLMFTMFIPGALVALGLIGTVFGFIIMMQGMAEFIPDASAAANLMAQMASGMGTALYTTLLGAVCSLWASVNNTLVSSGTISLIAFILEDEAKKDV